MVLNPQSEKETHLNPNRGPSTVVLLPGMGMSSHIWDWIRPALVSEFKVLTPSWQDAHDVLKSESAAATAAQTNLHLVAFGVGSVLALEWAKQSEVPPKSCVLVAGFAQLRKSTQEAFCHWVSQIEAGLGESIAAQWQDLVLAKSKKIGPVQGAKSLFEPKEQLPSLMLGQLQAAVKFDLFDCIDQCTWPTLLVHGEKDKIIAAAHSADIRRRCTRSQMVIVKNGRHDVLWEHSKVLSRTLLRFLLECEQSSLVSTETPSKLCS